MPPENQAPGRFVGLFFQLGGMQLALEPEAVERVERQSLSTDSESARILDLAEVLGVQVDGQAERRRICLGENRYLIVGATLRLREVDNPSLFEVPRVLDTFARKIGWTAVLVESSHIRLVLDPMKVLQAELS